MNVLKTVLLGFLYTSLCWAQQSSSSINDQGGDTNCTESYLSQGANCDNILRIENIHIDLEQWAEQFKEYYEEVFHG